MKIPLICLIFLFAVIPILEAQIENPVDEEEVPDDFVARPIEEIEKLFHQRQYQVVIKECKRLLAYDPWRWEAKWARMKLSECYAALGQPEKAQSILAEAEAAISHPREKAEILMWQLCHAVEKEDLDNARKLVDEITTKFIGDYQVFEAMEVIIESDLEHGWLEDARRWIDQMIQQYPFQENTFWLTLRLGEHYRERGGHQQAIELFQKIQKNHPDRVEAFVQLAETYWEMGELDQAIKACNAAIETFPAHWSIVHVWSMMGGMHQEKGDLQAALKAFLTAGEFRGTDQAQWALRRAAQLYQQLGKSDPAIALLTRLSQGYPDRFNVVVLRNLAEVYAENFDYDRAESILKDLVESFPQTEHAHEAMMQLLEMYWRTNQREKAIDFLSSLLANPNPYLRRQAICRFIEASHEEDVIAELEVRGKLPELAKMFRQAADKAVSPAAALPSLRGLAAIAQWMEN